MSRWRLRDIDCNFYSYCNCTLMQFKYVAGAQKHFTVCVEWRSVLRERIHAVRHLQTIIHAIRHLQTIIHAIRHLQTIMHAIRHLQTIIHAIRHLQTIIHAIRHLQTTRSNAPEVLRTLRTLLSLFLLKAEFEDHGYNRLVSGRIKLRLSADSVRHV